MPALVAGIHVFSYLIVSKTWMAGSSPAMTKESWSNMRFMHVNPRLSALTAAQAATM
jgi:hypothetical protein